MKDIIDILEEQCWLEIMDEQGLLNEKGKLKLKGINIMIENMSMIVRDMDNEA